MRTCTLTFCVFATVENIHCMHGLPNIDPKKFRKSPSAARFFPKG